MEGWVPTAQDVSGDAPSKDQLRLLHATIKKVTTETEELRFNTAIAAMMEFVNAVYKWPNRPRKALAPFPLLLAPYAPHLAEELWRMLGNEQSLTYAPWPEADESLLVADTVNVAVQVNGKTRGAVPLSAAGGRGGGGGGGGGGGKGGGTTASSPLASSSFSAAFDMAASCSSVTAPAANICAKNSSFVTPSSAAASTLSTNDAAEAKATK